jgi:ribosome-associated toxin RatA of RatAB toxin-antitoxin module
MLRMSRRRLRSPSASNIAPPTPQTMWNGLMNCKKNDNDHWLSATKTKNFALKNTLSDWLDIYYVDLGLNDKNVSADAADKDRRQKQVDQASKDLEILFNKGNKFEDNIMDELKKTYINKMAIINTTGRFGNNRDNYQKTKTAMTNLTPIIGQAVLYNDNNNTFGSADLVVRSDYFNQIFNSQVLTEQEEHIKAPKLKQHHYRVIDIKWMNLPLHSRADTLRKVGFIPAYKSQLAIYNCALGNMQGYIPERAYIMGKGWNRTIKKEKKIGSSCFEKLGVIDYNDSDNNVIDTTKNALEWYRDLKENGNKWSPLDKPEEKNKNMFPNLCSEDSKWCGVQKDIAVKTDDPILVCNVGPSERANLHSRGIYTISDPNCNAANMGLNTTSAMERLDYPGNAEKIDNICYINRDKRYNIFPRKIQYNEGDWQVEYPTDMYFDFETVNVEFVNTQINVHDSLKSSGIMIFMFGVGYIQNGVWNYEVFTMDNISMEEEMRCMDRFANFILKKAKELDPEHKCPRRLFHWSQAEISNLNQISARYNNRWINWEKEVEFVDMFRVFKKEGLAVKGAYDYSLKSIGNALYKLGKIHTRWPDSDIANGKNAMFEAAKIYQNKLRKISTDGDQKLFNDIIAYNEIDCKIIWEIVAYLREHHNDLDPDYQKPEPKSEPKSEPKLSNKQRSSSSKKK